MEYSSSFRGDNTRSRQFFIEARERRTTLQRRHSSVPLRSSPLTGVAFFSDPEEEDDRTSIIVQPARHKKLEKKASSRPAPSPVPRQRLQPQRLPSTRSRSGPSLTPSTDPQPMVAPKQRRRHSSVLTALPMSRNMNTITNDNERTDAGNDPFSSTAEAQRAARRSLVMFPAPAPQTAAPPVSRSPGPRTRPASMYGFGRGYEPAQTYPRPQRPLPRSTPLAPRPVSQAHLPDWVDGPAYMYAHSQRARSPPPARPKPRRPSTDIGLAMYNAYQESYRAENAVWRYSRSYSAPMPTSNPQVRGPEVVKERGDDRERRGSDGSSRSAGSDGSVPSMTSSSASSASQGRPNTPPDLAFLNSPPLKDKLARKGTFKKLLRKLSFRSIKE
ncbi:hypothetical protein MKEN_00944500 [Mycena kentingensis (nom. inval.)]|nr:hypothetical protein MKEN_00944500 [Mycena kentingensis (nom. inval.)]